MATKIAASPISIPNLPQSLTQKILPPKEASLPKPKALVVKPKVTIKKQNVTLNATKKVNVTAVANLTNNATSSMASVNASVNATANVTANASLLVKANVS